MTSKDSFYEETFLAEFKKRHLDSAFQEDQIKQGQLQALAEGHLEDLTGIPGIYFDTDTLTSISLSAARHLSQELAQNPDLMVAWSLVVESFQKNYWHYPTFTEPQSTQRIHIGKELFAYIWAMVQALMIMKVVIFYLGLKSASDAEPKDKFFVFAAICFSFGSLFFFAWRKTRRRK